MFLLYMYFAEFVRDCVDHIISLYQTDGHKPSKVVLVGHSMVGIVIYNPIIHSICFYTV